jgi:glucuronoarabinoxylan endo-1,4-beta-xylanase
VQLDQTHQTIEGFGINDTWGSQFTSTVADSLFTTTGTGLGLSILRVGMSPIGAFYNSFESANISAAKSRGAKIIGTCWSPPASCKDNNKTLDGGQLLASCYTSWATTITNFAKNNGLYAMSIANEPDFASCGATEPCNGNYDTAVYTANEMVAFVKVAGPLLQAAGVKVIAPEPQQWLHLWSNESATGSYPSGKNSPDPLQCGFPATSTTCASGGGYDYGHWLANDSAAWAAFDILGVHEYDTQHAEAWPSDVPHTKPVWTTEMSGIQWWPEQGPSSDINNGVAIAGWIHSALVTGDASAWLWWWYQAAGTDDNEGLLLKDGTDTKRHYTLGNYSKFIRPGYTRVDITGNSSTDLLLSAYKATDGTVVVVAINKGTVAATVPISISGGIAPASCTPNVTSATDNLKAGTAVTVTGGIFTASLAATTVTTFVCK